MHIHIPDGVLPVWLWSIGFVILAPALAFCVWRVRSDPKRSVFAAFITAVLLVVFSLEVFGIHLNFTALAGILLGPWWSLISMFILNMFLAAFGHGGITVIGLNTLGTWIEALVGYSCFRLASVAFKKSPSLLSMSAGAIAVIALTVSFLVFVGLVWASSRDPGVFLAEGAPGAPSVSLSSFVLLAAPFTALGAVIEAVFTAFIANYIIRAKPGLVYGVPAVPHRP